MTVISAAWNPAKTEKRTLAPPQCLRTGCNDLAHGRARGEGEQCAPSRVGLCIDAKVPPVKFGGGKGALFAQTSFRTQPSPREPVGHEQGRIQSQI